MGETLWQREHRRRSPRGRRWICSRASGRTKPTALLANHQGLFSAQGIGLKLAIAGAAVGTQQFLLHKHPTASVYKTGALINFAVAGALRGVAAHNYGVRPVQ